MTTKNNNDDITEYITDGTTKWIDDNIKNKYNNSAFRVPLKNKKGIIIEYALVDPEDYIKTMKYKWNLTAKKYASGSVDKKTIKMHHFIFRKPTEDNIIDHIDEDKLNNLKNNLIENTIQGNNHNKSKNPNIITASIYKGVSKSLNRYKAICYNNNKAINLGTYSNDKDAAIAYDKYTFKFYGKNANNNKLIKYEDTIDININSLIKTKEKNLPLNIHIRHNKYKAMKKYKVEYNGKPRDTIKEAQNDLIDINVKINRIKLIEELKHMQKPIVRNSDNIAIIKIKDTEILVDDKNWHKLSKIKWKLDHGYARNNTIGKSMHRYISNAQKNEIIDHKNKSKNNNCETNLRISNGVLNAHNKSKSINASSKYFGVVYSNRDNIWRAQIQKDYKHYNLGDYKSEIDAALAYNVKASELYGSYANLNILS